MSSIASFARDQDQFGAVIGLKLQGKSTLKTLGGGLCSLSLKIITIAFFCMQLAAVVSYQDPQISSYQISESRI